ncbi:MAG: phosphoribosylanthranilate isomerase [Leucobacter sp.]
MYIKVCGLRDAAMTSHAISCGADAVGVVMSEPSPRHATPEQAAEVVRAAKRANPAVDTVLVVNRMSATQAAETARDLGFDVLQLHSSKYTRGDFDAALAIHPRVWRAVSLAKFPRLRAGEYGEERTLVDGADPGSGEPWDLSMIDAADLGDGWILAGGLDPANVADAIAQTAAWGVDVSSGVEGSPGAKDPELIARFVSAARSAVADSRAETS